MKKGKVFFSLIIVLIFATTAILLAFEKIKGNGEKPNEDSDEGEKYIQSVSGFDEKNLSNISYFEEIPIVSQELLDRGISGGEGGQWPLCLAGDNNDGKLVFYGTDVGGIFKSTDGGETFKKSNIGLFSNGICDIAIDPNNENNVVCFGVNGGRSSYTTGIYYSTDAGDSWNFSKHFPINGHRNTAEDLAYDPTSYDKTLGGSSVLYLSLIEKNDYSVSVLTDENRGLHKSTDGGKTWTQINKSLGDAIVKVDENGTLFCGNYNGLFVSYDKGETFETIISGNITGLDVVNGTAYILENSIPNDDGIQTYAKIYTFKDKQLSVLSNLTGGNSDDPYAGNVNLISENWQWHYVKGGKDEKCLYHFTTDAHKVYMIKVSPVNPNNMVLVYTNTLYYENASHTVLYSKDGGKTFNISLPNKLKTDENADYNMLPYSNRKMNFYWSPVDENVVFDFENDWLSVSKNGGESFYYCSNGINGIMCGGKFNFNLFNSDIMFFGSQDYFGALTVDGGKTWKFVNLSKDNPLGDGANVYGGYAASENVLFGVFAPRNSRDRYLTISFDGGETTNIILEENRKITEGYVRADGVSRMIEQASYSSYQSPKDKNILFCADLRSADFGKSWSKMSDVTGVYASDFKNGNLYGINDTLGQVVKSTDDGLTWSVVANSTDLKRWWNNAYISDLAFDSKNKIIYVTCQWGDLFAIYENEKNKVVELTGNIPKQFEKFPEIAENLGSDTYFATRLTTVAVDPVNSNVIYVGGANYKYRSDCSLFRSCDGGKTFYCLNANATNSITQGVQGGAEPLCVRVNPKNGEMWCAGNCLGFSKLTPPYETEESTAKVSFKVEVVDALKKTSKIVYVRKNRKLVFDEILKSNGYEFEGFFKDEACSQKFDEVILADTKVYIKMKNIFIHS